MFKNDAASNVWSAFSPYWMQQIRLENNEKEVYVIELIILHLARTDEWVMTLFHCLVHEDIHGGLREKKYV